MYIHQFCHFFILSFVHSSTWNLLVSVFFNIPLNWVGVWWLIHVEYPNMKLYCGLCHVTINKLGCRNLNEHIHNECTLHTVQINTRAAWAAFFCAFALCPCCFLCFAAFSAAFACDWIFCCPLAILITLLKHITQSWNIQITSKQSQLNTPNTWL